MKHLLRLHRDRFAARAAPLALPPSPARALYVVEGGLQLRAAGVAATLGANSALHAPGETTLAGGSLDTLVLRWELVRAGAPVVTPAGEGVTSELALEAPLALDDAGGCLLRCDRVDFPPGGEALLHTHQGGGIRCLLFGSIRIESEGAVHAYAPLDPWFEAGPEPVYAAADAARPSAFARVMILPRRLLGQSSIRYVRAEDQDRPKSQRYQVFIDLPVELP